MIQVQQGTEQASKGKVLRRMAQSLQGSDRLSVLAGLMKQRGVNMADLFHNFQEEEIIRVLEHSEPVVFSAKGDIRSYELYLQVPAIIVLEGCVEVSYTDLEGERKKLDSIDCRLPHSDRMFEVSRSLLASAVKQTDLNLLTDFRVQNPTGVPTLAILINNAAFETALEARQQLHIMRILRQREVLKYYGIETEQTVYTQQKLSKIGCFTNEHAFVLLLTGKLCIMKDTLMLSCYNEGLFSRSTNEKLGTKFVVIGGSDILTCDNVWKNQKYQEGEQRRLKHLEALIAKYKDMPEKEVKRIQKAILQENELDASELEPFLPKKKLRPHQSLKEQSAVAAVMPKLTKKLSQNSQTDDLKSTKTSLDKKCTIRIRVKKK